MKLPIKNIGPALLSAVLLFVFTLSPAAAQGAYPGGYGPGAAGRAYGMPMAAPPAYPMAGMGYAAGGSMMGRAAGGYGMGLPAGAATRYMVRFGDTLNRIAARFGTTPLALLLANPRIVNANRIFAGELLLIPAGDHDRDDFAIVYRVAFGDTLARIAARFHLTQAALLGANPAIRNRNLIFAGQRLVIPPASAMPGYAAPSSGGAYPAPSSGGAYAAPSTGGYAAPPAAAMPMAPPAPAAPPAPMPQTVTVPLTAQGLAFSTNAITVPAGSQVVVHFNNRDNGVMHNFAVYTDSSAGTVIFRGPTVMGPGSTTYTFTAPTQPGSYFFRCDVHPTMMTGSFVVQ